VHNVHGLEGVSLAAADAARLAAFWQVALGDHPNAMAMVRVTEGVPACSENDRVNLGVRLHPDGPADLLAAGGSVVRYPGPDPWYVLADPEGNQFTGWPAAEGWPCGAFELVVRCHGPRRLAHWWARLLGGEVNDEGSASVVTGMPAFPWEFLVFEHAEELKRAPNRMRWHVQLREGDPEWLRAVGAIVLKSFPDGWLMADPEGNEFFAHSCAFLRPDGNRPVGGPAADRTPAAGLSAALPLGAAVKPGNAGDRAPRVQGQRV
jgi:hypothetical protein